jgi:hypothetical protein
MTTPRTFEEWKDDNWTKYGLSSWSVARFEIAKEIWNAALASLPGEPVARIYPACTGTIAPVQPTVDVGELVWWLSKCRKACDEAATALLSQQAEIERLKAECADLQNRLDLAMGRNVNVKAKLIAAEAECVALQNHAEAMYRWITDDGLVGWIDEANDYRVAFPARKP